FIGQFSRSSNMRYNYIPHAFKTNKSIKSQHLSFTSINSINISAASESELIELMNSIIAFENCENIEANYINSKDIEIDNSSNSIRVNTSDMDIIKDSKINKTYMPETN
ncbi:1794_t:CDS:1, partial [Dentiscutata erythropus]